VLTTPAVIFYTGLFFLQNYLQPPKSAAAANIVIGTVMKRCKGTSHTLIRGPWGRQNYFIPKRHYLVLAINFLLVWQRWLTVIHEYLRKFSKKFKTSPMEYLGAWGGNLFMNKTWSWKSHVRLPLKAHGMRLILFFSYISSARCIGALMTLIYIIFRDLGEDDS
jgi:hypothetical protein